MNSVNIVQYSPFIGAIVGGIFMMLIVYGIKPGRRGKIRTERDHFFEGRNPQEVRAEMEKRLLAENFTLIQTTDPMLLKAVRKKRRPNNSVMRNYPFHRVKLDVEVRLNQREDGVVAKMSVGVLDSLISDTGEGEYLEVMLDYMMIANTLRPMAPVANMTNAMQPMFASILLFSFPLMFLMPSIKGKPEAKAFLEGLIVAAITIFCWAVWGVIQIAMSNGKFKGMMNAVIAIVMSVLAFIFGVLLFLLVASGASTTT